MQIALYGYFRCYFCVLFQTFLPLLPWPKTRFRHLCVMLMGFPDLRRQGATSLPLPESQGSLKYIHTSETTVRITHGWESDLRSSRRPTKVKVCRASSLAGFRWSLGGFRWSLEPAGADFQPISPHYRKERKQDVRTAVLVAAASIYELYTQGLSNPVRSIPLWQ